MKKIETFEELFEEVNKIDKQAILKKETKFRKETINFSIGSSDYYIEIDGVEEFNLYEIIDVCCEHCTGYFEEENCMAYDKDPNKILKLIKCLKECEDE